MMSLLYQWKENKDIVYLSIPIKQLLSMYFTSKTIKQKIALERSSQKTHFKLVYPPCEREKELKREIESVSFYHHKQNQKIGFHQGQKSSSNSYFLCSREKESNTFRRKIRRRDWGQPVTYIWVWFVIPNFTLMSYIVL